MHLEDQNRILFIGRLNETMTKSSGKLDSNFLLELHPDTGKPFIYNWLLDYTGHPVEGYDTVQNIKSDHYLQMQFFGPLDIQVKDDMTFKKVTGFQKFIINAKVSL
jgi:hypothetical protein